MKKASPKTRRQAQIDYAYSAKVTETELKRAWPFATEKVTLVTGVSKVIVNPLKVPTLGSLNSGSASGFLAVASKTIWLIGMVLRTSIS